MCIVPGGSGRLLQVGPPRHTPGWTYVYGAIGTASPREERAEPKVLRARASALVPSPTAEIFGIGLERASIALEIVR